MFSGNGFRSFCLSLLLVYCHLPSSRYSLCLCHFRLSFSSYLIHIFLHNFLSVSSFVLFSSPFSYCRHLFLSMPWLSFVIVFLAVYFRRSHSVIRISLPFFISLGSVIYSIIIIYLFLSSFISVFRSRLISIYVYFLFISLSHLLSSQKIYLHLAWLFGNLGNREWECAGNRTAAPATGLRAARILEAKWRSCREEGLRGEGERV